MTIGINAPIVIAVQKNCISNTLTMKLSRAVVSTRLRARSRWACPQA